MQRLLGSRRPAVGEVAGDVEQCVGAVVERAPHVELLGLEPSQPDALDQARRNGRARHHRRHVIPQQGGQRRADVDGGEAQARAAPRAVDPGHLALAPGPEPMEILGEMGRGGDGSGRAAGAVEVETAVRRPEERALRRRRAAARR